MQVEFEAVCKPKFMIFWDDVRPLVVVKMSMHLTDCLYHVPFPKI